MTPMIDVVFQLIIFFLVSSHLAQQEVHLDLPLPLADSGQPALDDQTPRVTVNVTGDGRLLVRGRAVEPVELRARLERERAAAGADLEVRIRSDRQVAYRKVEPVLRAAAQAQIWNVTFAVYRRREARP